MAKTDYSQYTQLSPFELKDNLIALAQSHADRTMLNAGRGNPNFMATVPRRALFQLGLFAAEESEMSFSFLSEGVGGFPLQDGLTERFQGFLRRHAQAPGVAFLARALSYVRDQLGLDADTFMREMVEGVLGCNYPVPDRMLLTSEAIVKEYVLREMGATTLDRDGLDLFAVEGGTAAMAYMSHPG